MKDPRKQHMGKTEQEKIYYSKFLKRHEEIDTTDKEEETEDYIADAVIEDTEETPLEEQREDKGEDRGSYDRGIKISENLKPILFSVLVGLILLFLSFFLIDVSQNLGKLEERTSNAKEERKEIKQDVKDVAQDVKEIKVDIGILKGTRK